MRVFKCRATNLNRDIFKLSRSWRACRTINDPSTSSGQTVKHCSLSRFKLVARGNLNVRVGLNKPPRSDGIDAEIDVLAYTNIGINEAYVVEVKSHLREEGISRLSDIMANFQMLLFSEVNYE